MANLTTELVQYEIINTYKFIQIHKYYYIILLQSYCVFDFHWSPFIIVVGFYVFTLRNDLTACGRQSSHPRAKDRVVSRHVRILVDLILSNSTIVTLLFQKALISACERRTLFMWLPHLAWMLQTRRASGDGSLSKRTYRKLSCMDLNFEGTHDISWQAPAVKLTCVLGPENV